MSSPEGAPNPDIQQAIAQELGGLDPESVALAGNELVGDNFELSQDEARAALAAAEQLQDGQVYPGIDGRGYAFRIIRNGAHLELETDRDAA